MTHYRRSERGRLYRSREGLILGVCRGLATYFDIAPFWVRFMAVMAMLLTGFWPVIGAYLIAALLIKPEPVIPIYDADEQEFYDSYTQSRQGATHRLRRRYQNLERRIRRMEDIVTGKEFDWEKRFNGQ